MDHSRTLLGEALRYSFPVFLGYLALGVAFSLFTLERGYPWFLALLMSTVMYAGAGQFIAVGMFVAGSSLAEAVLIQFMVNARHLAYGLSMLRRFRSAGAFRPFLIFGLTDETFALLSSLPPPPAPQRERFMFMVSLLNYGYWMAGSLLGVLAGSFIPWDFQGMGFALTALFIVLMIEQIIKLRRPAPFVVSALAAAAAVFLLPGALSARFSLLAAILLSLGIVQFLNERAARKGKQYGEC